LKPASLVFHEENGHKFSVLRYECDLAVEGDAFFVHMIEMARNVYGEYLLGDLPDIDPSVSASFDLEAIRRAIRQGMPDPTEEQKKPANLRNYRSEAAELIARKALSDSYGFIYPAAAQVTKGNAAQPILGFDGWGLIELASDHWAFVLLQVKGSDENKSPPTIITQLSAECGMAPQETTKLARALTSILALVKDEQIKTIICRMLEKIGKNESLRLIVAPVIVRGSVNASLSDIHCLGAAIQASATVCTHASSASIGVGLEAFGKVLFEKARSDE
jgi:hypothetical protein